MKSSKKLPGIIAGFCMMIVILDSKTAQIGAKEGIDLCIRTVIPSLFPFIVLSNLMVPAFFGENNKILYWLSRPFHIPEEIGFLLVPAFFGGYPVGAQCIYRLYSSDKLQKDDAERLLAFLSNVGPAFLFGVLLSKFQTNAVLWRMWIIQFLGAVTAAQFISSNMTWNQPTWERADVDADVIGTTVRILGKVCGWIILFRIIISFLERWLLWAVSDEIKVLIVGLLEISNSCSMMNLIADDDLRFIICNIILSFGGICVLCQTRSVCYGLKIRWYIIGKSIQAVTAAVLAVSLLNNMWSIWLIWGGLMVILSKRNEKRSRISNPAVV